MSLLAAGDQASIDAAIIDGYIRVPPRELDPWAFAGAIAAIIAEPW